jgi:hypothetical protein
MRIYELITFFLDSLYDYTIYQLKLFANFSLKKIV